MRAAIFTHWEDTFEHLMGRLRGQTPGLSREFLYKDLQFVDPQRTDEYDCAFVLNYTHERIACSPEKAVVLILEPPEITQDYWYPHPQEGALIFAFCSGTPYPAELGLGVAQTYYTLSRFRPSTKPLKCSMICSYQDYLPWHHKRREILAALMATDLDIHFYGKGMELTDDPRIKGELPLNDKSRGLQPYSFVIDFENSPHMAISDKMFDPLISGCVPITNSLGAVRVFPENSYEWIDFCDATADNVNTIAEILAQTDLTKYNVPVRNARKLLLEGEKNLCEWFYRKVQ